MTNRQLHDAIKSENARIDSLLYVVVHFGRVDAIVRESDQRTDLISPNLLVCSVNLSLYENARQGDSNVSDVRRLARLVVR